MEKISGVYAIMHPSSGRAYIGSSKDVLKRWAGHKQSLQLGSHHSPYLQRAWNKYGADTFHFITLEQCSPDERIAREQFWIDQTQASNKEFGFNVSVLAHTNCPDEEGRKIIAESNRRRKGKPILITEEEKSRRAARLVYARSKKMPGARPSHVRAKISESLTGQKHSAERNMQKSLATKGKPHKPHSEETKEKIRASHIGMKASNETKILLRMAHWSKSERAKEIHAKISATKKAKKGVL